jgi:hypothetical protein
MGSAVKKADIEDVGGNIRQTQGPPWKLDDRMYDAVAQDGTWHLVVGKHWEEGSSWPWHDCPEEKARYWILAEEILDMKCSYCGEAVSEQIITLWKLYSAPRIGEWLNRGDRCGRHE